MILSVTAIQKRHLFKNTGKTLNNLTTTPIKLAFKKLGIRLSLYILAALRSIVLLIRAGLLIGFKGLLRVWVIAFRPITLVIYKLYIVSTQRLSRFFHAQHKMLAVLTHRFALHFFVILLTLTVVSANVVQAQSVRSDEFMQNTLVAQIIDPTEETTITADTVAPASTSYIDNSTVIKLTPDVQKDPKNAQPTTEIAAAVAPSTAEQGTLTQSNGIQDASASTKRNTIESYVVQEGDTASTIAAKFGISTKTVLWVNDLEDASLIKPGQTLHILPTTGIAYTVKEGETVDQIAEKYKSTSQDIIDYNNFLTAADLTAGEEIIIPNGEEPPPPPPPTPDPAPTTQLASVRDVFNGGSSNTSKTTTSSGPAPANAPVVAGAKGQWPTVTRRISQYYGAFHTGLDIDGEFGDPIYASDSGKVISAGSEGAYGIAVRIQHANGTVTHYGHLQVLYVQSGQSVGRGQTLGQMGSTGRSTGSHLHFECLVGGRFTNPYNCVQ